MPGAHHSQVSMCPLPQFIPNPCGLILIYPALDFEMSCWMSSEQLSLIRAESTSNLFRSSSLNKIWQSKDHLHHASPLSVMPDLEQKQSLWRRLLGLKPPTQPSIADLSHASSPDNSAWATNRIALTSRMCFFNDRIITLDLVS